jgi:vacuolar protein sorting-associated protein VTA1
MAVSLPPCPASLRPVQHYLKLATEHDARDPVVAYWARLTALQAGLQIDKSSPEALAILLPLMEWLEGQKKVHKENDAVVNEVVASAHIENYAMKLFLYADKNDRAGNFGKNVVKSFYSAGILFDVMQSFGEVTPEVAHYRKYAKMKAAYIHNCLKSGEVSRGWLLRIVSSRPPDPGCRTPDRGRGGG